MATTPDLQPFVIIIMKNNSRLSLAEMKAKADQSSTLDNLEAIQGGNLFDCHGKWGAIGKKVGAWVDEKVDKIIEEVF